MKVSSKILGEYERDGVVLIHQFLNAAEIAAVRAELERYIRDDLAALPADARTFEKDEKTVRNLWRLEKYSTYFRRLGERADILTLVAPLVHGDPVLVGVETFNKPARIGSGVPYHQDNAYFCQSPPDMLTVWIAIDSVTQANGPVFFVKGSHLGGMLPTRPSGVRGNSIGMAHPSDVPLSEQFCALLAPGDATIHHCETIHHSAPNTTEHSRLGLLLVYRGSHTQTDPHLKTAYATAVAATPPA
ncbi:phytanoyl-CoA dioxygenase family protein [Prosthecobacter vanneervenii]|uniref:Ectoine hydroxylase-related dioxygenase (Phytanoyl-CoA dioxygenase family) n=1 Tax=Prosthecobacter vanneervenii TaxID=48466 RepID=A0A7W7Y7U2_9BACT|nr:phytanoyl-CoA dioxygenase family protein [Prosthecobacter vanneervenii]MBB5031194.1 ectoine hydroxylase-related dioxygenase (phytanoyl-CoA dioxygenase family) [Prosthecobacter vanneervenii]